MCITFDVVETISMSGCYHIEYDMACRIKRHVSSGLEDSSSFSSGLTINVGMDPFADFSKTEHDNPRVRKKLVNV